MVGCRRALNCLEALARGAEDRATLNVFPRWHDHGLEAAQGGFANRGQQRKLQHNLYQAATHPWGLSDSCSSTLVLLSAMCRHTCQPACCCWVTSATELSDKAAGSAEFPNMIAG